MESSRLFEQLNTFAGKLPHQQLSKIVTVTLLIYCAYLSADLIWKLAPTSSEYGRVTISASSMTQGSSATSNKVDLSDLLSINLFGDLKKKAVIKPQQKTDQPAPRTRLNVTLTGLVADSSDTTSKTSVAIIESAGKQDTYGIDEKIHGTPASVHEIRIDRVILFVSGRFETLMLDGIEYSTSVPGSENKVDRDEQTVDQEINPVKDDKPLKKERLDKRENLELSRSLRAQRETLFDDPKKLLDVIRIRPYRKSGELKGYKLSPGKDGKLFTEVGLKRNDLATSINGYDLTDMQQALSVMKELRSMTEATITVVRNDTSIDIILAL
ncbi:type II secretion system protein GspC [Psychrosphaera saromensis]|uniref:Type II secretion system protein GspC n=1 Tax=Psychrosphaera saromensis TaxID=716813 RepID=A0A2S7UTQ6_9GAMM|nr:type II secretion system protein GspC [Psychrosphaera saromensis]PQJ52912.1 type II secretion system protein GspC [Psychrosphaera saromensis]GHB77965.1 type II secretion system protein GspC [Psychrosphaera saromensis]GLQ12933.1 type II secretion system protein GspC [Psychrosphaera saromensis]